MIKRTSQNHKSYMLTTCLKCVYFSTVSQYQAGVAEHTYLNILWTNQVSLKFGVDKNQK